MSLATTIQTLRKIADVDLKTIPEILVKYWYVDVDLLCMAISRMTIAWVILLSGVNGAASTASNADGWHLSAGAPINFRELELHVGGKPLSVYEIIYSLHPMNDPGTFEPVGLWIYNYVEFGSGGQAENCKKWFGQVVKDESEGHKLPFPYLEFDTQSRIYPDRNRRENPRHSRRGRELLGSDGLQASALVLRHALSHLL